MCILKTDVSAIIQFQFNSVSTLVIAWATNLQTKYSIEPHFTHPLRHEVAKLIFLSFTDCYLINLTQIKYKIEYLYLKWSRKQN
jgi:hypothetical protein